jgi:hypothetical protein
VNTGPLAAAAWLAELGLTPSEKRWFVELDVGTGPRSTRFQLDIYAEEWGYRFHHDGRRSWIRVTDIPFVHGADDHELLAVTPPLRNIGRVMRDLEARYEIELPRDDVSVRTNVDGAESIVRAWARML